MTTRREIIEAARAESGTPFHHQGRCSRVGIDCIGLLVLVARSLGIPHKDSRVYGRDPSPEQLRAGLVGSGLVEIPIEEAGCGDVLVFWIRKPHLPKHVAIKTENGILHTYADVGKVVEHVLDAWWKRRIYGAWRFPGLCDEDND